jgi:hypothetical protein
MDHRKQEAFLKLRDSFARSIHLVHSREDLPYSIYTDASKLGIGSILTQKSDSGETLVSTASRVLTPVEQRYTTCEQELLAVVYALQKFRKYVVGHPITVYSDNMALSFLKKCHLTSSRVTRWILQLQEYDLTVEHISGVNNFFADILSRNPVGSDQGSRSFRQRGREFLVAKLDLSVDKALLRDLGNLSQHQLSDPVLAKIREQLEEDPTKYKDRYMIKNQVLLCKYNGTHPYWRAMLPSNLEYRVIKYVHTISGHQGTDKCVHQISQTFHLKNLGRKVRKYVSHCDVCQRVKHPNRAHEIVNRSHLPTKPGELVTIDLYGPLPTGRGQVKYLLVCLEFFSKHVTLYPLRAATTRSCLNKLTSHYFKNVVKPEILLSDNGSQFTSPAWKKTLSDLNIDVRYSPIRHPESNPTERVMRELGKYFRIYCSETHKKWPELVPHIERWLNSSVCASTGYAPIELLGGETRPDFFKKILKLEPNQGPTEDSLPDKILKAYARMKVKADERNRKRRGGRSRWQPKENDSVLVKCQHASDQQI